MRPEALTLAVRPREPYEAADLGVRLVQTHAPAIYRAWFAVFLPVVITGLLLDHFTGWQIAFALIWWLKPLYDYTVLWLLSRAVFGVVPGWREVLGAVPGFFRQGLLGALTLRRLSLSRAFVLPVRLLEGQQSGKALNARVNLLRRRHSARARMLHQIFALFETVMLIGLVALFRWLAGVFIDIDTEKSMAFLNADPDTWQHAIVVVLYSLAVTLVEPLYVAAGFMLYLNRRTMLEGWDLEIALRSLVGRLDARRLLR